MSHVCSLLFHSSSPLFSSMSSPFLFFLSVMRIYNISRAAPAVCFSHDQLRQLPDWKRADFCVTILLTSFESALHPSQIVLTDFILYWSWASIHKGSPSRCYSRISFAFQSIMNKTAGTRSEIRTLTLRCFTNTGQTSLQGRVLHPSLRAEHLGRFTGS